MTGERDLMLDGMLQFAGIVQNHAEKTREEYDRQASEKATKEQAIRTRAKMMGRAIASREVVVREQNVPAQTPERTQESPAREQEVQVRETRSYTIVTGNDKGREVPYGSPEHRNDVMMRRIEHGIAPEHADIARLAELGQSTPATESVRQRPNEATKAQNKAREVESRGIERRRG